MAEQEDWTEQQLRWSGRRRAGGLRHRTRPLIVQAGRATGLALTPLGQLGGIQAVLAEQGAAARVTTARRLLVCHLANDVRHGALPLDATCAEAQLDLFWSIEVFYNRHRLRSSLGYQSPASYLAQWRHDNPPVHQTPDLIRRAGRGWRCVPSPARASRLPAR